LIEEKAASSERLAAFAFSALGLALLDPAVLTFPVLPNSDRNSEGKI
jgi:hypothetical protein